MQYIFRHKHLNSLDGYFVHLLLKLWKDSGFLADVKIVTLTTGNGRLQLRFWCGEPASITRGHVDSMGKKSLIVEIDEHASDLTLYRLLRDHMVGDLQFTKEEVDGVEIWRRVE